MAHVDAPARTAEVGRQSDGKELPDPLVYRVYDAGKPPAPNVEVKSPGGSEAVLREFDGDNPPTIERPDTLPAPTRHSDGAQWTYLVNLSADLNGTNTYFGALRKLDQMRTELMPLTADGRSQVIAMIRNSSTGCIEMYKIAGGKVEKMGEAPSKGTAEDLQRLVSMAPDDGKVALINQGHGLANEGVSGDGDRDPVPVADVANAIKNGLQTSGRQQLDMLSFDSCLMGNAAALGDIAPVARTVVASEALEFASSRGDGQEVTRTLSAMMKQPPTDGEALGRELVRQSGATCDETRPTEPQELGRRPEQCGVETLAVYDGTKIKEFSDALTGFGNALSTALDNPANRAAINDIIKNLPRLPGGDPPDLKDLHQFAEAVLAGIRSGKIKDDGNRTLQNAAVNVIAAQSRMIPADYSSLPGFRGVNVLLLGQEPDKGKRYDETSNNVDKAVTRVTELIEKMGSGQPLTPQQLRTELKKVADSLNAAEKEGLILRMGPFRLVGPHDGAMPGMQDLMKAMSDLTRQPMITAQDLSQLRDKLRTTGTTLSEQRTTWLAQQREDSRKAIERMLKAQLHGQPLESATGWDAFVIKMHLTPA